MAYLADFKKKYGNPADEEQAIRNVWLNGMRKAGEQKVPNLPRQPASVNLSEYEMMGKYEASLRGRTALLGDTIYTAARYEQDPKYQAFKAAELASAAQRQRPPISGATGAPRRQLTNAELASLAANPPVAVLAPRRPAMSSNAFVAAQRSANNVSLGTNAQRKRAILQLERLGRTYTNAELAQEIKKVQRFDATMKSRKKGGKSRKQRKTRRN